MNFRLPSLFPGALCSARPLLMAASLLWLSWVLAQWTWLLFPAPPAPEGLAASSTGAGQPVPLAAQPRLAETINAAALWGQAQAPAGDGAEDTRLPLALRGVLAGQGLALIAASGQAERVFRVGDTLPGGAILRAVRADHVLLERAGNIERLALPKDTLLSGPTAASAPKTTTSANLRSLLQSSPVELAKHFRLEPVVEAGRLRGYRIRALRDPGLLQRAGLEAEDIVLSVNGRSLLEVRDMAGLMNDLRDAAALDAIVLRHGSEMPLRIDLNG